MATHYVLSITAAQYPGFQQVCCGRLPKTHAEWWWIEERNHRDLLVSGHKIIAVEIAPGELRPYCQEMGCQADGTALDNLTSKKGCEQARA